MILNSELSARAWWTHSGHTTVCHRTLPSRPEIRDGTPGVSFSPCRYLLGEPEICTFSASTHSRWEFLASMNTLDMPHDKHTRQFAWKGLEFLAHYVNTYSTYIDIVHPFKIITHIYTLAPVSCCILSKTWLGFLTFKSSLLLTFFQLVYKVMSFMLACSYTCTIMLHSYSPAHSPVTF